MASGRNFDEVWLAFSGNEAMSDEKVDDDEAAVRLEGGWIFAED